MKILYSWLREFVPTRLSPADIETSLMMAGIEVSGRRFLGEGFEGVVVARILSMAPHPNADKLSLCRVTDGSQDYRIVCGARNMKAGDVVALSRVGSRLPNGMEIRKARIRGEVSEGMLCSEAELGLSEEAAGIMILPGDARIGSPLADAIGLNDWLIEVEITPNRGDCLSVLGVAREVGAIAGEKLTVPAAEYAARGPEIGSVASVGVTDRDLCPRYSALVVTGLTVAPSPDWMQRRLGLCGIRPINNVVDVTNYVLLELGQPMHAFDLDRLRGATIDVRRSGIERRFRTLDGTVRTIAPEMLLIWDSGGPVAVAGVMGGENTEVLPETRRVLFESAHFDPLSIRRTSRRLGLSSESSYRFERGVDPEGTMAAARRAVSLLAEGADFEIARGAIDVGADRDFRRTIPFRAARASRVVGCRYTDETSRAVFSRLGFDSRDGATGAIDVTVPAHRFDLEREIDLVEEVARLTGYDSIPTTYPPSGTPDFSADDRFIGILERAAEFLRAHGFSQAINLSFVPEREWTKYGDLLGFEPSDAMRLRNPISEDATMMRPHLLTGLLHNVELNVRRFADEVRLFEFGKAFGRRFAEGHFEEPRLAFVAYGTRNPGSWSGGGIPVDFHDLKGVAEALLRYLGARPFHFVPTSSRPFLEEARAADILEDGEIVGWAGAVHRGIADGFGIPGSVHYCEIRIRETVPMSTDPARFREVPRYPPVSRDISCVFPQEVPVGDVAATIRAVSPEIESASVFDVYSGERIGEGRKSVAFRVRFQAPDRTLTDAEVNSIHTKILELLENRFGGQIRSK